jgi:hypothetical protein
MTHRKRCVTAELSYTGSRLEELSLRERLRISFTDVSGGTYCRHFYNEVVATAWLPRRLESASTTV